MKSSLWINRMITLGLTIVVVLAWNMNVSPAMASTQVYGISTNKTSDVPTAPGTPAVAGDELWSPQFELGADDVVEAVLYTPNGDLYVGGNFNHIAGIAANHVARWDASANKWSALGSGVTNLVASLAYFGSKLYVGCYFTQAGGVPAGVITSYDVDSGTWSDMGGGMARAGGVPWVSTLVTDGSGNLYAGGRFDSAGGVSAQNIAKWDGSNWSALGDGLGTPSDNVNAIALSGSDIYAGGSFDSPAGNIAHFNGVGWSTVGGGVDGRVTALAISGSNLYVGGFFFTIGGGSLVSDHFAKWNTSTYSWSVLGSGSVGAWTPYAIAIDGNGNVYVGGQFSEAGGIDVSNVAMWDGTSWSALRNSPLTDGVNDVVYAMASEGNDVMVAGYFSIAGGYAAPHIARWNSADKQWYSPGNTVNGPIYALASNGSDIYVGGNFTSAGGLAARSLARWNLTTNTWHAISSSNQLTGCNGVICAGPVVYAIAINGTEVYVGGNFDAWGTSKTQTILNNIGRIDGGDMYALGDGVTACETIPFCTTSVHALAPDGTGVDAGGIFIIAGAITANNIARWDGSSWNPFTDQGNTYTGTNGPVFAIGLNENNHYLFGGSFTTPTYNLVGFYGQDWLPPGILPNDAVKTIYWDGSIVYIGGEFTKFRDYEISHIAFLENRIGWQPLGYGLDATVNAISGSGNMIYAGGDFMQSGGMGVNHIAAWDLKSQSWTNLGNGTDGQVDAITFSPDYVFIGGNFSVAGDKTSQYFARYRFTYKVLLPVVENYPHKQ